MSLHPHTQAFPLLGQTIIWQLPMDVSIQNKICILVPRLSPMLHSPNSSLDQTINVISHEIITYIKSSVICFPE